MDAFLSKLATRYDVAMKCRWNTPSLLHPRIEFHYVASEAGEATGKLLGSYCRVGWSSKSLTKSILSPRTFINLARTSST